MKKEPNPALWGRLCARDKCCLAARSAVFKEYSKDGGRRFTLDWLGMSVLRKVIQTTILLAHYIILFKLRTKLLSHKMLKNLTFVVQFSYFSISPKEFFLIWFFEQLLIVFWATFWEITGTFWKISSNLWKAPKREQESIPERWVLPLSVCHWESGATYEAITQSLNTN